MSIQIDKDHERITNNKLVSNLDSNIFITHNNSNIELKDSNSDVGKQLLGILPKCSPKSLGDKAFRDDYATGYAYYAGGMANGISSEELVIAMGKAGFLASYGSGGVSLERLEKAILTIKSALQGRSYLVNLLHSPGRAEHERATVDLFLKHGVTAVEAAAYISLTADIVRYRAKGVVQLASGEVISTNKIIAKVSRIEVASRFLAPAPDDILKQLVSSGQITEAQANLAKKIPMADDITVEADSGGHTDNRPLVSLLPYMISVRDKLQAKHKFSKKVRIGAAGGIGTPLSALGAFSMGAAYIVTGSINQSCVEAGTSEWVKKKLAEADMADVAMAPSADMFEHGGKVQVLKKGTMYPMVASNLLEIYKNHDSIEEIPAAQLAKLEKRVFKQSIDSVWLETQKFWNSIDPAMAARMAKNPKKKMGMIFRWYLGQSSRWAVHGEKTRLMDMQVWCGQAMGAFNAWARGTTYEKPENRKVAEVALTIMTEAAELNRVKLLDEFLKMSQAGE